MQTQPKALPVLVNESILIPILIGGLVAGTFDLILAFVSFGWGVPRAIAAGLLGRDALHGGAGTWSLGILLHYFIAYSAAAVYCAASRKLDFLKSHFVVCGMFYGIGLFLVMNLVVLPLSGLHAAGPYRLRGLLQGLLVHMIFIGLPIGFCLYKFSPQPEIARAEFPAGISAESPL